MYTAVVLEYPDIHIHSRKTRILEYSTDYSTKGEPVKIDTADRTPRETVEERLEKTPSHARCFAHGSSLMC
jgi:hypothetical protein